MHALGYVCARTLEIMCHPAERTATSSDDDGGRRLDRERVDEYRALVDARSKEALIASGATLINYGEL